MRGRVMLSDRRALHLDGDQQQPFLLEVSVFSVKTTSGMYTGAWTASCSSAFLAIFWKAWSTLTASFADVSKYGMSFFELHQLFARVSETPRREEARSLLFPITTNGNLSAFVGAAWTRNSSIQDSKLSKDLGSVMS